MFQGAQCGCCTQNDLAGVKNRETADPFRVQGYLDWLLYLQVLQ